MRSSISVLRSAHFLAYRKGMSQSLRTARLELETAAVTRYWRSQPIAGTAASCISRTGCYATPCRCNLATASYINITTPLRRGLLFGAVPV